MIGVTRLSIGLLALFAAVIAASEYVVSSELKIELQPGYNAVTWNGAEPYAIGNFEDTPVTQIHRWDAVGQEWLSCFVGQDGATLPELHLLPRVQYLIVAETTYDLTAPDPLAGIDPHAALRYAAAPDDPLRFEAYWPNEDSPLEDLVVLRGEDERLSVKAEIAGGVGDASVWWMIDGRVNHAGLASDDVDLKPGGHDRGRLYAVDDADQVVVVAMPRIVRLPKLELPEMIYGVQSMADAVVTEFHPDIDYGPIQQFGGGNWPAVMDSLDLVADGGFSHVRINLVWSNVLEPEGPIRNLSRLDRLINEYASRGLAILASPQGTPEWTSSLGYPRFSQHCDADADCYDFAASSPHLFADFVGSAAQRWPEIRFWQLREEPLFTTFWKSNDAWALLREIKAGALAIFHANPDAVVVAPGLGPIGTDGKPGHQHLADWYEHGLKEWVDVIGFHPFMCPSEFGGRWQSLETLYGWLDDLRATMSHYGDAAKPIWITSTSVSTSLGVSLNTQERCLVALMEEMKERNDVTGFIIWQLLDEGTDPNDWNANHGIVFHEFTDGAFTPKPSYWAIREYLTGKPPPE